MKKKFLIPFVILFNLLFFAGLLFLYHIYHQSASPYTTPAKILHLAFVGDLMCHQQQLDYAQRPNNRFDFSPAFRLVKGILSQADFTFGNLETSLAGDGKPYVGYPTFNTPDEYAEALMQAGFDGLITANNHALDGGKKGAIRTLEVLAQMGMRAFGTFTSKEDRKSIQVYDKKDMKFALLAYTQKSNNHIPASARYLINTIDTLLIQEDIRQARSQYKQLIIGISLHFGTENQLVPNEYQTEIVEAVIRAGADFIVGSHPHTLQPIQRYATQNATLDTGVVAFSLGNFLSHQIKPPNNIGGILHLYLSKADEQVSLEKIALLPTLMGVEEKKGIKQHLVIPWQESLEEGILRSESKQAFEGLSQLQRNRLNQGLRETKHLWEPWATSK